MKRNSGKLWRERFNILWSNSLAKTGLVVISIYLLVAFLGPYFVPFDPYRMDLPNTLQAPSLTHLFGTDELGRDIFSRLVIGAGISLSVGVTTVMISFVFGTLLGAIAGYFGGMTDAIIMRIIDIKLAFPEILLAIVVVTILGPGLENVVIAVGIQSIPQFARMIRSKVLSVKESDYVLAARGLGAGHLRILFKHILPNCMAPMIVLVSLRIGTAIITASGLSFLGLGAQPPTPEWGAMLATGRNYLRAAPWVSTIPGLAIMAVVFGFNVLGDGLRDAMDPRMKK